MKSNYSGYHIFLSLCLLALFTATLPAQTPCDYNCALANADRDIAERPGDGSGYLLRAQVHYYYKQYDKAIADCTKALSLPGYGGTVSREHYEDMIFNLRSNSYFDKGDYQSAIRDLTSMVSRSYSRGGSNWHWRRANAYFNVGNFSAALADYNSYGNYLTSKKDSPSEYFYLYRGETHFNLKNYDLAISDLTAYAKILADRKETPSGGFYRLRAEAYYLSGKKDPAISDLNIALAKDPKDVNAYFLRGNVFRSMGNTAAAIDDYTKAAALYPQSERIFAQRALTYWDRNEYDLAIADYSQAIKLKPDLPDHYIYRSSLYAIKKDFDLAIADMTTLIGISPNNSYYYWQRGRFHYLKGDYGSAIADQTQVIKLKPQEASGYCVRATYFEKRSDQTSAVADLSKAIEVSLSTGYICRSEYYVRQRNLDLALADARKAVEVSKEQMSGQYARIGEILLLQGKLDEALESFNKEIAVFPQPRAFRLRGEVFLRKGDISSALADADEAIKKSPSLGYLLRANVDRERGNYESSLAGYLKALDIDPESADVYYNRALLYLKMKKTPEARADLKKAIEIDQYNWEAQDALAKLSKPPTKPAPAKPSRRPRTRN